MDVKTIFLTCEVKKIKKKKFMEQPGGCVVLGQ